MDDLKLAKYYLSKAQSAKDRDIEFRLPFMSYKNLMQAKRCGYTDIPLTTPRIGKPMRATDRTIDRIDNTLGYAPGNVIAVCNAANQIKAVLENPNNPLSISEVRKMLRRLMKFTKPQKRQP